MTALLALLPCAAILLAVLALRWSGLAAAALAVCVTAALWLAAPFAPAGAAVGGRAAIDAALLTLIVAAMVVPGILFVEATRSSKGPEAMAGIVGCLSLPPSGRAILIAIGIGVPVESLTGMGVSLLVTMPLLAAMAGRRQAIALGLVGMSLMPWGALAISAHVGAGLAGTSVAALTPAMLAVSGPVAFMLPLLCVGLIGGSAKDWTLAAGAGAVLVAAIGGAGAVLAVEIAGVAGGLAVAVLCAAVARERTGLAAALAAPGLRPYLALIVAVVIQQLAIGPLARAGLLPQLSTGRVTFNLLSSPGVALLAASLLAARSGIDRAALRALAGRAWRPIASVALFMLAARPLVEIGGVATLAGAIAGLGPAASVAAVAMLGAVSGFVTGSGITGNALFMPSAAAIGEGLGQRELLAALQNGAAGHVAMASLPVAAILLAGLPGRTRDDDAVVMRAGLGLAAVHIVVLTAAAIYWLQRG